MGSELRNFGFGGQRERTALTVAQKQKPGRQTRMQIAEEETGIEFSSMRRSRGIALFKLKPMPADMLNAH